MKADNLARIRSARVDAQATAFRGRFRDKPSGHLNSVPAPELPVEGLDTRVLLY